MHRFSRFVWVVVLVAILSTGCSGKTTTPSPVPPSPSPEPSATLVAATPTTAPATPTVAVATATPEALPTPQEGKGNVHGLLDPSSVTLLLQETELYLGVIFASETGDFSVYYFDRTVHTKARWVNPDTGEFLFENVTPGEYVPLLWWDISSYVAVRDFSGKAVQVTVPPGATIELGLIVAGQ